jgi:hypothetical protein
MPIRTPDGYLDITNATLRGSEIITTSKVGIANSAPTHTLSVGNKLFVDDSAANVLTVSGNLVATSLKIGQIDLAPSYGLEHVANVINTVSNVVQFTNTGTGFVSVSNVGIGTSTSPAGLLDVVGAFRMRYQDMGVTKAHIITGGNSTSISESGGTYTYTRGGSGNTGNFLPNPSNIVPNVGQRYRVKLTARSDYAGTIRYECPTSTIITTYDLTTSFKEYTWDFTATGTTMQFAVTTASGTTSQFNAFSIERLGVGFNVNPTSTAAPVQISGVTHFSDNVGIGTASPRWGFEVTPTNGLGGVLSCSDSPIFSHNLYYSGGWKYGTASTGGAYMRMTDSQVQFWNAPNSGSGTWDTAGGAATATQRMTINEAGNVGIGTNNPIAKLDIDGGAENNTTPALAIRGGLFDPSDLYVLNSYSVTSGVGYAAKVIGVNIKNKVETDNTVQIRNNVGGLISAGAIYFGSDNVNQGIFGVLGGTGNVGTTLAEYLTVRDDGNVGIGTASPAKLLEISGASGLDNSTPVHFRITNTQSATNGSPFTDITKPAALISYYTPDTSTAGKGDVAGIGFRPESTIGGDTALCFYTDSDNADDNALQERMCITHEGNVGIGTNAPQGALHVAGDSGSSNTSKVLGVHMGVYSSSYAHIEIVSSGSNAGWIDFKNGDTGGNGDHSDRIRGGSGHLEFITNMSERMRIDSSGNVGIGIASPAAKFDVRGASHDPSIPTVHIGDNAADAGDYGMVNLVRHATSGGSKAHLAFIRSGNTVSAMGFHNNTNTLGIWTSFSGVTSTPAISINSAGKVGIGTASPGNKLHIQGDSAVVTSDPSGNDYGQIEISSSSYAGWTNADRPTNLKIGIDHTTGGLGSAFIQGVVDFVNAGVPLLLCPGGGHVGIGTVTPYAKLHVNGTGDVNIGASERQYFRHGYNSGFGATTTSSGYGWGNSSIYASHSIVSGDFFMSISGAINSSDVRIKKNIVDADDAECLEVLRLLKPKKYQYKDEIKSGTEPVWGFIAQEVRETLPYATKTRQFVLPNIYELANVSSSNVITFTNFNTSNLESNATTLIRTKGIDGEDHDIHLAEVIDAHSIRVEEDMTEWTGSVDETGNVVAGNQLFVYGQEVDDFVFLKKEAIWTVATAALQEVDRQLQAEKSKTTALETKLQEAEAKTTTLETELQAEKTKTSTFETELQAEKTKTTTLETKLQEAEAKIATLQAEKEAIRSDLSSLVLRVTALES